MIDVDHGTFLGAVAAAQLAADRAHAAGFTPTRIAVIGGIASALADELLAAAAQRGWARALATTPVRWQLTPAGRQRIAGIALAAAHRPARRRRRRPTTTTTRT